MTLFVQAVTYGALAYLLLMPAAIWLAVKRARHDGHVEYLKTIQFIDKADDRLIEILNRVDGE